jgi:hypothetical protein
MKFLILIFIAKPWYFSWMILLYLVLIGSYSFITDGTKCVTFKTQITGGGIKIPEEDFRN